MGEGRQSRQWIDEYKNRVYGGKTPNIVCNEHMLVKSATIEQLF